MASTRPPVTSTQSGPGVSGAARGPHNDPDLETELERFERRLRYAREHPLFGVHPDGVGPTLGQDLGKPNDGVDLDWEHMGYNPQS
jgi:hypothetical protein